jgi:hypothetical protein
MTTNKKPNLIGISKAILDDGITIKPALSMRQVRLICYGLEEVIDNLNDGELLLDLHDTLGNKGPVSEAGSREELRELLHGIGAIVYGPSYYRS